MFRAIRMFTMALLGATFLVAGAVLATDAIERYTGTTPIEPGSPFCSDLGKASELGGDCFCVDGDLNTEEELDCLISSRVIPASEYASNMKAMGLEALVPICSEIGRPAELDGDCFCTDGVLSSLEELDCLIASGAIPEAEIDKYRREILTN